MIELTEDEVLKALKHCAKYKNSTVSCIGCPLHGNCDTNTLEVFALDLILKLKAEIMGLKEKKDTKTTDWLTRGIPKEQLEREKQEAIMSAYLQECITYDEWSAKEYGNDAVDFDTTASKLIDKGYHKHTEAEWVEVVDYGDSKVVACSGCENQFYFMKKGQLNIDKMPYCPKCGARMKGIDLDNTTAINFSEE